MASSSDAGGLRRADLYRRKIDLYAVLGVEKGATASQITKAYRALALRYHPDRNVGNGSAEAAEKFKEISTAYAILSDPNKRRQYDLAGADAQSMFENGMESVDLENLNSAMRAFGALMTKLGVPIPTQIGASTLIRAQEICKEGCIAPDNKHVTTLKLGEGSSGSTNRQQGVFYKIKLTEEEAANGVILSCCSANNSRFKLVVFDAQGRVQYVQESAPTGDKKFTTATMYLVPFETITSFGQTLPQFNEEPAIFTRLTTLTAESRSLGAGEHLICVYGDNWLSKTSYALTALLADLDPQVVATVKECDERIRQKKQELDGLQDEYNQAKEKFEQLRARVQEETGRTEALLQEREIAYNSFIDMSLNRHSKGSLPTFVPTPAVPAPAPAAEAAETLSTSVSSPLSEHGKDSKTSTATAPAAPTGAAGGGSGSTSTTGRGPASPSKRSFFSFFMPSSSSSSPASSSAKAK